MARYLRLLILFVVIQLTGIISISKVTFGQTRQKSPKPLHQLKDLNNAVVLSVIKDSRGFMWFTTQYGLIQYNGYDFKTYSYNPEDSTSLPNLFSISQLLESKDGKIWIGTQQDKLIEFDPSTENFITYELDTLSSNQRNWIFALHEDQNGNIWLGLQYEGFYLFNPHKKTFKLYRQQTKEIIHNKDFILSFLDLNETRILVGTMEGLYVLSLNDDNIEPFLTEKEAPDGFKTASFYELKKDRNGVIWFGTNIGLFRFDPDERKLDHYKSDLENPNSYYKNVISDIFINPLDKGKTLWVLSNLEINKVNIETGIVEQKISLRDKPSNVYEKYLDESGLLWLASENQGVFYVDLKDNPFQHFDVGVDESGKENYSGTAFYTDRFGNFWIGTGQGGLFKYDSLKNLQNRYDRFPNSLYNFPTLIYSMLEDTRNNLWITFWADGLVRYDYSTDKFERFRFKYPLADLPFSGSSEIVEDRYDRIWVGSTNGVYFYDPGVNDSIHFTWVDYPFLREYLIRSLCEDRNGAMWFSTQTEGLFYLSPEKRDSLDFIQYVHSPKITGSISSNCVYSVHCSNSGEIWAGTSNGLNRFNHELKTFEWFNIQKGFDAYFVFCVKTDNSGNVWAITEKGLVRFNPNAKEGKKFKLYTERDGLPFTNYYPYHFDRDKDGKMYIGGIRGFGMGYFSFHPDSLKDNSQIPPVALTDIRINNEVFPLDSAISYKKNMSLQYDQNFISFEFATLDYNDPRNNNHAYMLEGMDDDWVYCGSRRFANYTALPPGKYTFRVKGSNNDGYWNEAGTAIRITIASPPWKTWGAYLLYFVLIIGVLMLIIRYYVRRQRLLHQLEVEHIETEKLKELDNMKSKFFANISHEFRTPLTLIIGPLNKLLYTSSKKDDQKELSLIKRNAIRLQQLISQLLDLSKLESGKMKLNCSEINIVEWVRMYIQSFESLARQKEIEFIYQSEIDEITCWFDPEKMTQILNNLLSNAFKFTESGEIKVQITTSFSTLEGRHRGTLLTISDTGRGIPKDKLDHIFDRFYQADDSATRKYEGTGIGLALVKELVELHNGSISVESELNTGTIFTITLPRGADHLKPNQIVELQPGFGDAEAPDWNILAPTEQVKFQETIDNDKPLLLIVEDNVDMRNYIKGYFINTYSILEAQDGKAGFNLSVKYVPDIVVSDVMMPIMDGYQLSKKLKSDERTSHIPVILLTARSSGADKIEGLETGADDFVIKPFDGTELQVRIKNLVSQRKTLREYFRKEFNKTEPLSTRVYPSMDQQFLNKTLKIVSINMANTDFSVEEFAHEMAMSRVQLHRKMKAITDLSASDFIRSFRLKKAAEMLKAKTANVTEIAFSVGFNNPSWFAEQFKKQFGVLPSEFRKS